MYQRSWVSRDELCEDSAAIADVEGYLNGYQLAVETLTLLESEQQDRGTDAMAGYSAALRHEQLAYWRERAHGVCALIDAIAPGKEKAMLHYYYILGYTVEAAAEAMDVSRRTAFRIKKRGLALAASRYIGGQRANTSPPPIPAT